MAGTLHSSSMAETTQMESLSIAVVDPTGVQSVKECELRRWCVTKRCQAENG
jgi:hypothetical protein